MLDFTQPQADSHNDDVAQNHLVISDNSQAEIVDDSIFAITGTDAIDLMLAEREAAVQSIHALSKAMSDARASSVLKYFTDAESCGVQTDKERAERGVSEPEHRRDRVRLDRLFLAEPAIRVLDARMWAKAIDLTDVRNMMPAADRNQWDENIRKFDVVPFTEEAVRTTITSLLAQRTEFFARKIDGVFKALSGDHVTNKPSGFHTRMILNNIYSRWHSVQRTSAQYIQDLLFAVSKFMGLDEPTPDAAEKMLKSVRDAGTGQWQRVLGGSMRVRVYLKGTAHIEIHPEMAAKLNQMLHHLYPYAIPAAERQKPKKVGKEWGLMQRPLPWSVIQALSQLRWHGKSATFEYVYDKTPLAEAANILKSIGAVEQQGKYGREYVFDYPAQSVVAEIAASGLVPDQQAYQFYPTPEHIAQRVVELANIEQGMSVLEPSAGTGNIASLIPDVECIEVSKLRCDVLAAKGLKVR